MVDEKCLPSTIYINDMEGSPQLVSYLCHHLFFHSGAIESDEVEQDDVVPDCEVRAKSFHMVPSPPAPGAVRQPQDPQMTRLAQQMQKAGDALYERYGDRVDVRLF